MVQLRLRLPVATAEVPCPLCDGVADCFGVHAPCGGDRTKRHHALRAILAARAKAAGFHTDVEKPGLLPPRPEDGGAGEDGGSATNGRRPADVWVGNWGLLGPAAFDLAVTSGLRSGHLPSIAADGRRAVSDYEVKKKYSHQHTLATCASEGLQFLPWLRKPAAGDGGPQR